VAFNKESNEKKKESGNYFENRNSERNVNKFEFVDDWGEKYVGLVSLSLNVLNVLTGEIYVVEGIDDELLTVGQPVFVSQNEDSSDKPSYILAYTGWKNGPKKLGMIYCYQRESSIYVVDLTQKLETPVKYLNGWVYMYIYIYIYLCV
jgi:hypothetical protein